MQWFQWFPGMFVPGIMQWQKTWEEYEKEVDVYGGGCACFPGGKLTPHIHTSEGTQIVLPGSWIKVE